MEEAAEAEGGRRAVELQRVRDGMRRHMDMGESLRWGVAP